MIETAGTRALNIARLEKQLELIKQQITMSCQYPDHQAKLHQTINQVQARLDELTKTDSNGDTLCPLNGMQVEEYQKTFTSSMMRRSFVA